MSEPTRLRDEGSDPVRALLRHAPKSRGMTVEDKARTRARVGRVAAGVAVGVGSLAWLQGVAIGAGLGVLAVGAAEIAPRLLAPAAPAAPSAVVAAKVPAFAPKAGAAEPAASVAPVETALPVAAPEPTQPRLAARPPSSTASTESPSETDSLAREAALLERARAALGTSPAEALSLCEAHAAQFPTGKLSMERELVALDALRRLGRTVEARTRGEALLSRAKGGLYEERIRKLVDGAR